jgi:outer membrane protein assembly factor BamB
MTETMKTTHWSSFGRDLAIRVPSHSGSHFSRTAVPPVLNTSERSHLSRARSDDLVASQSFCLSVVRDRRDGWPTELRRLKQFIVVGCLAVLLALRPGLQAAEAQLASPARIEQLIRELASDSSQTRDKAGAELLQIGLAARPALKALAQSANAEIRQRAEGLLEAELVGRLFRTHRDLQTNLLWNAPIGLRDCYVGKTRVIGSIVSGQLIALDRATGERAWEAEGGGAGQHALGTNLFYTLRSWPGDQRGLLIARNSADGTEQWRRPMPPYLTFLKAAPQSLILYGENGGDAGIKALDPQTGKDKWQLSDNPHRWFERLEVIGDVFYWMNSGKAIAGDTATGQTLWAQALDGLDRLPTPADDMLYWTRDAVAEPWQVLAIAKAISLKAGREVWSTPLELPAGLEASVRASQKQALTGPIRIFPRPPVAAGELVLYSASYWLDALDAKTGKTRWRFVPPLLESFESAGRGGTTPKPAPRRTQLFFAQRTWQNTLLLPSGDGLYGVDLATGEPLWLFRTGWHVDGLEVADGVAYFHTFAPGGGAYPPPPKPGLPRGVMALRIPETGGKAGNGPTTPTPN